MLLPNAHSFRLRKGRSSAKYLTETTPEMASLLEVEATETVDSGKRGFLRLAGLLGLGIVATTVLPNKAEAYVLGGAPTSPVVGSKDASNNRINPAKEDGNLATVATNTGTVVTNTNPFVASGAGGYIRQDSTATIAKESGGNLAAINTQLSNLTFSGGALVTSGSGSSTTQLKDASNTVINPATEDAVVYLRRLVRQVDSLATVDSSQRQRITVDAALPTGANTIGAVNIAAAQTLATVTTVGTLTTITNAVPVGNVATFSGVDVRYLFTDTARTAYASGIRTNLNFS